MKLTKQGLIIIAFVILILILLFVPEEFAKNVALNGMIAIVVYVLVQVAREEQGRK